MKTIFVCALGCEARPIIEHYKLKQTYKTPYPIYEADRYGLIQTGIGRLATAAATGYIQAMMRLGRRTLWINVGVAGHPVLDVGSLFLVHKITDHCTGHRYYPTITCNRICPTEHVITVDQPETNFEITAAYDMEAAAFFKTASRFSTSELVQALKVVSDNHAEHMANLGANEVRGLVEAKIREIVRVVQHLEAVQGALPDEHLLADQLETWTQKHHFSSTQQAQLRRHLQRFAACGLELPDPTNFRSAKDITRSLESLLAATQLEL